ncbi:MAG: hypothetical protein U0838_14995 [Chloroflexota bacterium]
MGTAVIDFAPPGSKEIVVSLFGTNDKAALLILVTLIVLAAGAAIGLAARRNFTVAGGLVVALVAVGALASLRDPLAVGPLVVVAAALQVGIGLQVLLMLLTAARAWSSASTPASSALASASTESTATALLRGSPLVPRPGGRVPATGGGWQVRGPCDPGRPGRGERERDGWRRRGEQRRFRRQGVVPARERSGPGLCSDASFNVPRLTAGGRSEHEFYQDRHRLLPARRRSTFRPGTLRVFGKVDKEIKLTFDGCSIPAHRALRRPSRASNEVSPATRGQRREGWTGVRLADVFAEASVRPTPPKSSALGRRLDRRASPAWLNSPRTLGHDRRSR